MVEGAVTGLQPGPDGVAVTIRTPHGVRQVRAQRVGVAIGGRPSISPEVRRGCPGAVHSDAVIRRTVTGTGRVVVIGGSHSAFSAVRVLLDHGQVDTVTVLHRSPIKVTYDDPDAAAADGCRFGSGRRGSRDRTGLSVRRSSHRLGRALPRDPRRRRAAGHARVVAAGTGPGRLRRPGRRRHRLHRTGERVAAGRVRILRVRPGRRPARRRSTGARRIRDRAGAGRRRDAVTGGEKSFAATIDGVWFYRNVVAPAMVERLTSREKSHRRRSLTMASTQRC